MARREVVDAAAGHLLARPGKRTCGPLRSGRPVPPRRRAGRRSRRRGAASKAWRSIGIAVGLRRKDGHQEDPDIEAQRPVVDIVEIVLDAPQHLVIGARLAAQAVDLRPSGDSGLDVVAGRTQRAIRCSKARSCASACGRGPTSDMLPSTTLKSCGNSSMFQRRMKAPSRVMRGSSLITLTGTPRHSPPCCGT